MARQRISTSLAIAIALCCATLDAAAQKISDPMCLVADDPEYAFSNTKPVPVGGGAMYGGARQRRYLDALRGPAGQLLQYRRTGSQFAADRQTLIDVYRVTYDSLEQPMTLFLDSYHFVAQRAPRGLICERRFDLGLPPADPFMALEEVVALALEDGARRDFEPIPIDAAQPARGAVYDHFRVLARGVRAGKIAGPIDRNVPPPAWAQPRLVIVARPLTCADHTVPVVDVTLLGPQGDELQRDPMDGAKEMLPTLLPGVEVPASSRAVVYGLGWPRPGLTIAIEYREPVCPGDAAEMRLPVTVTGPRIVASPAAVLPAGAAATADVATVQVLIDHDGALRRPVVLGAPAELTASALTALANWRAEPARVNGAPIVTPLVIQVRFEPPAPK